MATPVKRVTASRRRRSPYFDKSNRQCSTCKFQTSTRSGSRSRHFASAPSPAVQSVMTMGSFVDRLGGRRGTAISTFMTSCQIFSERFQSQRDVERACRHLCLHGCFYWSYAPAREWHSLREAVRSISGTAPGRILDGWRCILTVNNNSSDSGQPRFRVKFISPDGVSFDNVAHVLKALNCSSSVRSVKSSRISATSRAVVRASSNGRKRKRLNAAERRNLTFPPPALPRQPLSGLFGAAGNGLPCPDDEAWSPFGLLEELFADDPWRLLLSTILLNRTTRRQVDSVLHRFLERWPTAQDAADANITDILEVVTPLGIKYRRSAGIIRFSNEYNELLKSKRSHHFDSNVDGNGLDPALALDDRDVLNLHGCGRYALSAYRIFIVNDLDCSLHDHALHYYVDYRRSMT
jgi:endonuclease III